MDLLAAMSYLVKVEAKAVNSVPSCPHRVPSTQCPRTQSWNHGQLPIKRIPGSNQTQSIQRHRAGLHYLSTVPSAHPRSAAWLPSCNLGPYAQHCGCFQRI